jgi:hypothetical protein
MKGTQGADNIEILGQRKKYILEFEINFNSTLLLFSMLIPLTAHVLTLYLVV